MSRIAAVAVIALVTALAVATEGRVPLWSGLLGAGTMLGAYETTFVTSPVSFLADSLTAATTVLLSMALGLLITSGTRPVTAAQWTQVDDDEYEDEDVPLESLMLPAPRPSVDADVEQETRS